MSKILRHRRCGNTTRQVDEWVQQLFEIGECVVIDHAHKDGNMANRHALDMLLRRLENEHSLTVGHKYNNLLRWDEKTRTLTLLPF